MEQKLLIKKLTKTRSVLISIVRIKKLVRIRDTASMKLEIENAM